MASVWDRPKCAKKKWWEYTHTQKKNIEKYVEAQRKKSKSHQENVDRSERLKKLNKNAYRIGKRAYHDQVSIINWVKDTPKSLAKQFIEWKKHAK